MPGIDVCDRRVQRLPPEKLVAGLGAGEKRDLAAVGRHRDASRTEASARWRADRERDQRLIDGLRLATPAHQPNAPAIMATATAPAMSESQRGPRHADDLVAVLRGRPSLSHRNSSIMSRAVCHRSSGCFAMRATDDVIEARRDDGLAGGRR